MSEAKELTPKQEKFAQKYIETGSAADAYRLAYDAENMKPVTIRRKAAELLEHGNVSARVRALQALHLKRHAINVDTLTDELEQARRLALEAVQPSAAVSASMGKAKLHGLIVEKSDVTVRKPITEMTDDELNAEITEYERAAGTAVPGTAH